VTHSDPHWGAEDRDLKARNIVEVLELLTDRPLSTLSCVDIGCGSGGISFHLSPAFKTVCGIDPEPWQRWDEFVAKRPNLSFQEGSVDTLGLVDASIDVVICNQVYEHVPSPEALISQIHRILKPGGVCYFAGPNLLYPIEPHVFWPCIHWIPRPWALAILRKFAPEKEQTLDAFSTTYWKLRRWLREFTILDAVPPLIKHRAKSESASGIWRLFRPIPLSVLKLFAFLSPGFVFVLTKPSDT
jgi:SAM-dependent methyltransferase